MTDKKKFELEYLLKTSPKVLENMLCTPSGLSEWFANDVNIKDDVLTFFWDGDEESARLLSKRQNTSAKFQWLRDEEEGNEYFFEMGYDVDPVTKSVVMTVTDFAEENELEESQLLWDQQVNDLRRVLGA
ncbi:MAG: START-like domain-containing protein [Flavobacteriia bacterium]|jgi:hypothetical protein